MPLIVVQSEMFAISLWAFFVTLSRCTNCRNAQVGRENFPYAPARAAKLTALAASRSTSVRRNPRPLNNSCALATVLIFSGWSITWWPPLTQTAREPDLKIRLETSLHEVNWRFLTILGSSKGGPGDKVGKVEFVAEYFEAGQPHELHERSRFKRYQGAWKYLDGRG